MLIMNQKLFPIILILFSILFAQPKWHLQLGTGFYQPKLSQLNAALGDSSFFSDNILLNSRISNSILPIRPHASEAIYRLNRGQYNSVLSFTLHYMI